MAKQKMAVYFQPEIIKKIEQEYHEDWDHMKMWGLVRKQNLLRKL